MEFKTSQIIINNDGTIVDKVKAFITATSQYTNYIQVVAPFPGSDSVSISFYLRNARINTYTQYMTLQRDDNQVPLLGLDVVNSSKEYFQTVKDWNVWLVPIGSVALSAIAKWHSGTVDVSVTFKSVRNLEIENTGTYIGTFGSRKSVAQGDLPVTATEGDYYRCDYLDYYSVNSNLEFTLGDLAIYNEDKWIKGSAYQLRLASSSTEFGVDASIYGQDIESIQLDTTEMIIDRIAGLEAAILSGDSGGSYADNLYIRNGLELNYPLKSLTSESDTIYIERDETGYHVTIRDLVKDLPELDAEVLRLSSTESPYEGEGFYAGNGIVLLGSAVGPGISWDGENLYIRGTIQSGTITDPDLLEELRGPAGNDGADGQDGEDGYTPVFGVDYNNGVDGLSFKYIGTLPLLSSLSLISNPSINDSYRITETEELWLWSGTQWKNMGRVQGLPGSDGSNGLSSYLHIAYANDATGSTGFSVSDSLNKKYIGQYVDFTSSDSIDPDDYTWTLIKGADGADGSDGIDGVNAYLHIAYATSSNGSNGFSTSDSTNKTYIGQYTNSIQTDSEVYTDYNWTLIKGADGADGSDGANGVNAYLHIAYANSSNGSIGFSTSNSTDKTYIGTYTNSTKADSQVYSDYDWVLIKGADGADGQDGINGINSYFHVAYATSANGSTGFSTTSYTNATYIGTYTNSIEDDSETYTDYNWVLIKGADGADGQDGSNGSNAYLHIAYANSSDGQTDFSTTVYAGKEYMGTYTDSNETDSETYSDYDWRRVIGPSGQDGSDADQLYFHVAYSHSYDGSLNFSTFSNYPLYTTYPPYYIGTYTDTIEADSTSYTSYNWTRIMGEKGADGADGKDGTSVVLKGSVDTTGDLPSTGNALGDLYVVSADGDGYVWNGSSWTNAGPIQGPKGVDGTDGINGSNAYIHFAYATSSNGQTNFNTSSFEGATYMGTYTDFNETDSEVYSDYEWSLFRGADGADGKDGTNGISAYLHHAYANSSDGQTDFSTTWFEGAEYVGWYTNDQLIDSEVYTDYEWSLFKGKDGIDGTDGTNGIPSYIHYAYANSANGQTDFSTTWFEGAEYVGWFTDFNEADSEVYTDYKWSLFRGKDGVDGVSTYIHYAYANSSNGQTDFSTTWFEGAEYVGWYTNSIITDSDTYTDYEWSLFRGKDGVDGADGTDGISSYIHYAYANSANGQTDFNVEAFEGAKYVGWYTDFTIEDSGVYTDYDWSLFSGKDGIDGQDGSNGLSTYIHYAYATSATGNTGFSTTYTGVEDYMGWYTDFEEEDSINYTDYEWTLIKGKDGVDGEDGPEAKRLKITGKNAYKYLKDTTVPTYTSITLTAQLFATTGYDWEYSVNGGSTWITLSNTTSTYTNNYNDSIWGNNTSMMFKCSDSTGLATDIFSIYKLYDGSNTISGYLTNESVSFSANSIGEVTDLNLGLFLGNFKVFYGLEDVTDSTTFSVVNNNQSNLSVNLSSVINGHYELTQSGKWNSDYVEFTLRAVYGSTTIDKKLTVTKAITGSDGADGINGTNGTDGEDGAPGPGLVYRGLWSATEEYYANSTRRDVVNVGGSYYVCVETNINESHYDSNYWEPMSSFKNVATDLLLANQATITEGLVMGDASNKGFIRSYSKDALDNGDGFYLDGDGNVNIGDSDGNNLDWNGTDLNIKGNLSVDNEGYGENGIFIGKDDNEFKLSIYNEDMSIVKFDNVGSETGYIPSIGDWSRPYASIYINQSVDDQLCILSGATPTSYTGPYNIGAHTGTHYLYLESNSNDLGDYEDFVYKEGESFQFDKDYTLNFAHLVKSTYSTIYGNVIEVMANYQVIFAIEADDDNFWKTTSLTIPTGTTDLRFRFYKKGIDPCIDSIKLIPKNTGSHIDYDGNSLDIKGNIKGGEATSIDSGNGFYLKQDGQFRFGEIEGSNKKYIKWDNSTLEIKGDLSGSSGTFGEAGGARTELDENGIRVYNENDIEIVSSDTILQQQTVSNTKIDTTMNSSGFLNTLYGTISIPESATIRAIQYKIKLKYINRDQSGSIPGDNVYYYVKMSHGNDIDFVTFNTINNGILLVPSGYTNEDTEVTKIINLSSETLYQGEAMKFQIYLSSLTLDADVARREFDGSVTIQYTNDVIVY